MESWIRIDRQEDRRQQDKTYFRHLFKYLFYIVHFFSWIMENDKTKQNESKKTGVC